LRREVLDTLARRAEYNLAHMHGDIRLFEIGAVFEAVAGALPREEMRVGVLVMGRRQPPHFTDPKTNEFSEWARYTEWDAKGLAELVARVAYPDAAIELRPAARDGALWEVVSDSASVGTVTQVALDAPVWAAPAFGVEISLGLVDSAQVAPPGESAHRIFERSSRSVRRYQAVPSTPAAEFDLALLVPKSVSASQVEDVMRRVAGKLLERVEVFDQYIGQGVDAEHRSLAWRLTFRHAERTLRDREIESRRTDILGALADELNVRQRTS
jgi:phenylalanyl-tRNA synthetase beta chain